jgi:hypothetical protein
MREFDLWMTSLLIYGLKAVRNAAAEVAKLECSTQN